jgi:type III restriction enzyme
MSAYEVPQPILNSPFDEPQEHWHIVEGEMPEQRLGRRPSMYFYRDPKAKPEKNMAPLPGRPLS